MGISTFDFRVVKLGVNPKPYDIILCQGQSKQECMDYSYENDLFNRVFYYGDEEQRNNIVEMYNRNSDAEFQIDKCFCVEYHSPQIRTYIIK